MSKICPCCQQAIKEHGTRTLSQNSACHLYFQLLADALNESGHDMRKTLKPELELPWSSETVKEFLWRPIQKAMLNKESTTELSRTEVSEVYEVLARHLSQKLGVNVEFPSYR